MNNYLSNCHLANYDFLKVTLEPKINKKKFQLFFIFLYELRTVIHIVLFYFFNIDMLHKVFIK